MRPILVLGVAALFFGSVSAQPQDPYADRHLACFTGGDGTVWQIYVDAQHSEMDRTSGGTTTASQYQALTQPSSSDWPYGVTFATSMQSNGFFPTGDAVQSASWTRDDYNRNTTMSFTTAAGSYVFVSAACPNWNNCANRGNTPKHCYEDVETCCGGGSGYTTMSSFCVRKDNGDKCCGHYLQSSVCGATQSCCGGFGPGASSYSFCCEEGSTCCQSSTSYSGTASCCKAGTTCCRASTVGVCCADDEVCEPSFNRCRKIDSTAPTAVPPTQPPTTMSSPPAETTTSNAPATTTTGSPATTTSGAPATTTSGSPATTTAGTPPATTTAGTPSTTTGSQPTTGVNPPPPQSTTTSAPTPGSSGPTTTTTAGSPSTTAGSTTTSAPQSTDAVETPSTQGPAGGGGVQRFFANATATIPGAFFAAILADSNSRERMRQALIRDLARLLGVSQDSITINTMTVGSLIVDYTVATSSQAQADSVASTARGLAAANVTLTDSTVVYQESNPSSDRLTVSQSSASSRADGDSNNDADSSALGPQLLLIAGAVMAAFGIAALAN